MFTMPDYLPPLQFNLPNQVELNYRRLNATGPKELHLFIRDEYGRELWWFDVDDFEHLAVYWWLVAQLLQADGYAVSLGRCLYEADFTKGEKP